MDRPRLLATVAGVALVCALGVLIGFFIARPDTSTRSESGALLRERGASRERRSEDARLTSRPLITEGVTVQVLNGTRAQGGGNRMAQRLRRLGFEVVAVHNASVPYERTTVFWSKTAGKAAAARLATRLGWRSGPKPKNLSPSVTFHVVVGRDEV